MSETRMSRDADPHLLNAEMVAMLERSLWLRRIIETYPNLTPENCSPGEAWLAGYMYAWYTRATGTTLHEVWKAKDAETEAK